VHEAAHRPERAAHNSSEAASRNVSVPLSPSAARHVTEVSVGVLITPERKVLLADRPAGKAYAGYWEFPGGKIEAGETVGKALARELHEELDVSIGSTLPWVTFEFDYPHAYVRLHFERVFEWSGLPRAREGQRLLFHRIGDAPPQPLLPAAIPVLKWLALPDVLAPSAVESGRAPIGNASGCLLTSDALRRAPGRPREHWVGAWAESRADIDTAGRLGLDFALVGPVVGSPAHLGLGWEKFAEIALGTPLPLYAYGGIAGSDLDVARRHGAHGVAELTAA